MFTLKLFNINSINRVRGRYVNISYNLFSTTSSTTSTTTSSTSQMSNRKMKQKERAKRYSEKIALNKEENLQSFHSLLRQLYRKSHPDLVRSHSESMSKINDTSMQELNGILTTVKTSDYPPAIDKKFIFYVKGSTQVYEQYELHLKTSGGDCRKQLKKTFEGFFKATGISDAPFRWDAEYFPVTKYTDLEKEMTSPSNPDSE